MLSLPLAASSSREQRATLPQCGAPSRSLRCLQIPALVSYLRGVTSYTKAFASEMLYG